jgi:hypothetical protein
MERRFVVDQFSPEFIESSLVTMSWVQMLFIGAPVLGIFIKMAWDAWKDLPERSMQRPRWHLARDLRAQHI